MEATTPPAAASSLVVLDDDPKSHLCSKFQTRESVKIKAQISY